MYRTSLFAFLVIALAFCPRATAADAIDITGKYHILDEKGKVAWNVEITKLKDTYKVTWTEKATGEVQTGVGILDGDVFATSWQVKGGKDHGITMYRVKQNGKRLVGKWIQSGGKGELNDEVLVKQ